MPLRPMLRLMVLDAHLADCDLWRALVETVGLADAGKTMIISVAPTCWAWYAGDGRGDCKGVG